MEIRKELKKIGPFLLMCFVAIIIYMSFKTANERVIGVLIFIIGMLYGKFREKYKTNITIDLT